MRPGQNKRMRGRNNGGASSGNARKGPNPLTRSYESNGPDVKIRGTAHHVGEKYLQLARDAQSSGDPVMAESYLQHAEHYFRLIASAQQAQQQAIYGYQRAPGEQAEPEDDDDDFGNLPDRFASPAERLALQPAPQSYIERQPERQPDRNGYASNDRQPYEQRGDRSYERQPQPNTGYAERPQPDREQSERRDRPQSEGRNYDNRNGRPTTDRSSYNRDQPERPPHERAGQDRPQQDRPQQDRPQQDRTPSDRPQSERQSQERSQPERFAERASADRHGSDRPQGDRAPRDFDNRNGRGNRAAPIHRDNGEARPPVLEEQPVNGLPAFITTPTRLQPEVVATDVAMQPSIPSDEGDEANFHLRPRRRRRAKADFATDGEIRQEPPAVPEATGD